MKYHNQKTNGYDSKAEAKRGRELELLERSGEISDLRKQVKFELIPSQKIDGKVVERPCSYIADFTYQQNGEQVVEDCKGVRTDVYIIKRKLMLQRYGIRIKET